MEQWNSRVNIDGKSYSFQELSASCSISMTGLKVVDTYTTTNPASDDCGAMTLTCEKDGKKVYIRTGVLKDPDGLIANGYKDSEGRITKDYFIDNDVIDIKGVVEYYDGNYQIKVFNLSLITVH
jgi:hypothetical protein